MVFLTHAVFNCQLMITKYKASFFHLKKISKLPVDLVVGDVCSVVVTSVTVGLVVLTDTVVDSWVDVVTTGVVVVCIYKVVVLGTVVVTGEVVSVVDCTEVGGCVTTDVWVSVVLCVVPVVGDVGSVVLISVTVGLVVLTDTVVDSWVDVGSSSSVVVVGAVVPLNIWHYNCFYSFSHCKWHLLFNLH